jgi:PAS domain S-box-containing protein
MIGNGGYESAHPIRVRAVVQVRHAREQMAAGSEGMSIDQGAEATLLDLTSDAILVREFESDRIQFWNHGAEVLYGFSRHEAIGRVSHELLQTAHPLPLQEARDILVRTGRWEGELVHTRRDGAQIVVASRWALQLDAGTPAAILETNTDITRRKQVERDLQELLGREQSARPQVEAAHLRLTTLVEASSALASSLDEETTLTSFARAVVPQIADWCAVHLVNEDGSVRQVIVTHPDPAKLRLVRELEEHFPYDPNAPTGVPEVLRSGKPELLSEIPDELIEAATRDTDLRRTLRELGLRSSMVVPLAARGRILGAITFVTAESGRRFGPEDVAIAEILARRAALAVDNSRLYRAAQRVAAERTAILSQLTEGIVMCDTAGTVTFMNPAAARLYGREFVGRSLAEYAGTSSLLDARGERYAAEALPLHRALEFGEVTVDAEAQLRRADGSVIIVQRSATPVVAEDGTRIGAVLTVRDITAQRSIEQQKDDFLAAAAHDLKTPLTSLKGLAQILQRRLPGGPVADPERLLDGLRRIEQNATRMNAMINELLDLTRLQMGDQLELNRRPLDLVSLASRIVTEQQEIAGNRQIIFESTVPSLTGIWDEERLERVISNLLSNAIKYSSDGAPITVTVGEEGESGDRRAIVAVQDRGIGIPADDLPHIFERFRRGGNVGEHARGTGIGLAGVRQILEQHEGTIHVESKEGAGSTFTVRLPLTNPELSETRGTLHDA